jgi:hypothetical protein
MAYQQGLGVAIASLTRWWIKIILKVW